MTSPDAQIPIGPLHKAYSAVVTAGLPVIGLGLLLSKRGRRRLGERFGGWPKLPSIDWWFHGASIGEVQGLLPLIKAIRGQQPASKMFLTATSPTGLERGAPNVDGCALLPIDAPLLVNRALSKIQFQRFILSETELWPNAVRAVLSKAAPCHVVNGRISDYTLAWYKRLDSVFAPLISRFSSISVPDSEQRDRFLALGASPEVIHVTGHTKYDAAPRFQEQGARASLRNQFFPGIPEHDSIVTLGSIRDGEEKVWLAALERAWRAGRNLRVIVAPRHAEKFDFFASEMRSIQGGFVRWSTLGPGQTHNYKALLLDTMGALESAYAASDLAFIGATLVDIGGHNPFEPAMYGVPIVVGPYTSVIKEPIKLLSAEQGISRVESSEQIYEVLERVASSEAGLIQSGRAAYQVWSRHRGASDRVLEVIRRSEGLS